MKPNYNEIALFLELRGVFPPSAQELVSEYCHINSELIRRNSLQHGTAFEEETGSEYLSESSIALAARSKELFKIIYLRYGHLRNT